MKLNSPKHTLLLTAVLLLPATFASAQDTTKPTDTPTVKPESVAVPKIDPAAQDILEKSFAAQRALATYSADIDTTVGPAGTALLTAKSNLTYSKPNRFRLATTLQIPKQGGTTEAKVFSSSNGINNYSYNSNETVYTKTNAFPDPENFKKIMGGSGAPGIGFVASIVADPTLLQKMISPQTKSVAKGAPQTVDGIACDTVLLSIGGGNETATITMLVGQSDHLLRSFRLRDSRGASAVENYRNIKANLALDTNFFQFTAPAGYTLKQETPVKPTQNSTEPEQTYYDKRIKVGATPLPFSGVDMAGSSVNLSAYKGKVVLVDFWATWCGPCVAELPNVIAAYNKYHAQGFDVIGVTLDNPNTRQEVASFVQKNKMAWRQIYSGKGWQSPIAVSYGVQAIPFTMLIGKDGKIAAVGARGPELEPAIQAALAK